MGPFSKFTSMKLSIIVPIYNAEKFLEKCLKSIRAQNVADFECILIDDNSTDDSGKICDYFAIKDQRFKVVHKYNEGPAASRNLGIYLAKGEWIGFVDADDWIEPDHFSYLIDNAIRSHVSIAQTSINVYREDGSFYRKWHLGAPGIYDVSDGKILSTPLYDIGHCWDKIYKSSLIKDSTIKFANCDMCEDTIFNIKAVCKAGKILSLDKPTYNYLLKRNSLSHSDINNSRKIKLLQSFTSMCSELEKSKNYKFLEANIKKHFESILIRAKQIDYVFAYVDCTKTQWQKQYKQYSNVIDFQRFNAHEDLLRYKFRAIAKWMPWIGIIHMIVSDIDQVPCWVDQTKVHIVLHKDFIPAEYLPTFNSCTIEMFLQNIPGLSEKFIYSNDDMYPNDIMKPEFFFPEDKKLKMNLKQRKLWHKNDINQVWAKIPINSLRLAAKDKKEYLKKYVDGVHLYEPQHVDKPMFKSISTEVFNRYKNIIELSITRFRDGKNFNQYLFSEYALFHDYGVFDAFRFGYYQVGIETDKILDALKTHEKRPRIICCNESVKSTEEDYQRIENALLDLYPNKCIYEV